MKRGSIAAITALGLVGCFSHEFPVVDADVVTDDIAQDVDANAPSDAPDDVGDTSDADAPSGPRTLFFVIDSFTINVLPGSLTMPSIGFNLDGLFSSTSDSTANGCMQPDYLSGVDPTENCPALGASGACTSSPNPGCLSGSGCVGGVDNQLPLLIATLNSLPGAAQIRIDLNNTVSSSQYVTLIRLTDVDSITNDPNVNIFVYQGFPTSTMNCTAIGFDAVYQVARSSLVGGAGATLDDARYAFRGSITGGRLRAAAITNVAFELQLPVGAAVLDLPLYAGQLGGSWRSGPLSFGGAVGGWTPASSMVSQLCATFSSQCQILNTNIGGMIDIAVPMSSPLMECAGMTGCVCNGASVQGGVSLGFGFTTQPAELASPAIADAQIPGTCGYVAPVDAGDGGPG